MSGLFRFAVTRDLLKASPLLQPPRMRCCSSYTPYIYSEAELKRLLVAVPTRYGKPALCYRCGYAAHIVATLVRRRIAPWRSIASQARRRGRGAITHTHLRHEVLQNTHRPLGRQSECRDARIRCEACKPLFRRWQKHALFEARWDTSKGINNRPHIPSPVRDCRRPERWGRSQPTSDARPQTFGSGSPRHRVVSLRR